MKKVRGKNLKFSSSTRKPKKRLGFKKIITLVFAITAIITLAWQIINPFLFSPNLCKKLKQREQEVNTRIKYLKEVREKNHNEDFKLRYYDFEIKYSTAELQNILDSLKLQSCSN